MIQDNINIVFIHSICLQSVSRTVGYAFAYVTRVEIFDPRYFLPCFSLQASVALIQRQRTILCAYVCVCMRACVCIACDILYLYHNIEMNFWCHQTVNIHSHTIILTNRWQSPSNELFACSTQTLKASRYNITNARRLTKQ